MDLLIGQAKTRLSPLYRDLAKGENPFGEGVRARVASRGSSRQIHGRSIYRPYQSLSRWNNSRISAVLVMAVALISTLPYPSWERVIGNDRYLPRGLLTARYTTCEIAFIGEYRYTPIQISLNYSAILTVFEYGYAMGCVRYLFFYHARKDRFLDIFRL